MTALIALASPAAAEDPVRAADREAAEFIQQFPVIRVGITDAPGNGHQAYAILVMKRLRALGFAGAFEVLYDSRLKSKLEYLLPGFKADGPGVQEFPAPNRITAIAWNFSTASAEDGQIASRRAPLGIMGGDDIKTSPRQLNVDGLIRVQPRKWWRGGGTVAMHGQENYEEWKALSATEKLPTRVRHAEFSNPAEFLQSEMGHSPKLSSKIPGIQALLENLGKLEVMAAYGLSFHDGPLKLANLIAGIAAAKKINPGRFKGAVVIPMLSSFNEGEWAQFNKELNGVSQGRPELKILPSSDPDIAKTIGALSHGEILLMPVGSVTQDVWNTLVAKSTLPPTVAGASSKEFALARGRPFFVTGAGVGADFKDDELRERAQKAQYGMTHEAARTDPMSAKRQLLDIASFIADSMDPESQMSLAYADPVNTESHMPDKVSVSLNEARKHFEEEFAKTPQQQTKPKHCIRDGVEQLQREALRELFD